MGVNRVSISKRLRFEIFKRDNFTCQYCGKTSPDVLLEVDHIKPLAGGGKNDILNLVTSCRDCNRGKGKTELSDNAEITKQRRQLEEMNERRNQLKMMVKWREELETMNEKFVDIASDHLEAVTGLEASDIGRRAIRKALYEFSVAEVIAAIDAGLNTYRNLSDRGKCEAVLTKLGGICYNRRKNGGNATIH
jgi:hypothetical protein